jgi:proliferating cell nuclear antigen PCNA
MFEMKISDVDLLKNSIPIIAEIIDEGVFRIDKDSLSLLSPDRSMIAVVDFKLSPKAMDHLKVDKEETIGVNMSNLVSVIKRLKSTDKLIIRSGKTKNRLEMIIEGKGKRRFEIPLLDISVEKPPIDQLEFSGKVEVESRVLEEGIEDADIVDDSVVFEIDKDTFKIWSKGDVSTAELELKKGEDGLIKLHTEEPMKARYPLEYLKKMIKASKLSEHAVLEFGNDYPMKMTFVSPDKIHLSFILAPRVEE